MDAKMHDDSEILAQEERIREEEAQKRPLVSEPKDLQILYEEYVRGESIFLSKIKHLKEDYGTFSATLGDAFAYAWFETLRQQAVQGDRRNYDKALVFLRDSSNLLETAGFSPIVFEDFYTITVNVLETAPDMPKELLLNQFQSIMESNSIVMHLRFLLSAYLQLHEAEYAPFVLELGTVKEYSERIVEAIGQEAEEICVSALAKACEVCVKVVYLDATKHEKANVICFGQPQEQVIIHLLYRPGHYDVLYPK